MYEYTPRPDRRPGMALSLGLATVGLLLFIPFPTVGWLLTLLRCIGLWMLLSAFPVAERFVMTSFSYCLERTDSGEVQLTVTERRGRRSRTVCRVLSSSLCELVDPKERRSYRKMRRFNYCPDLRRTCHHLILEDDGPVSLRICPDERLCELILSYIEGKND